MAESLRAEAGTSAATQPDPHGQQQEPLLRVQDLVKHFPVEDDSLFRQSKATVKAVDGVSFDLYKGETLGLVGETGCGKSTVARTLMRLEEPTAGHAFYKGEDIFTFSRRRLRALRREIQMIFQDPYASLSPRMQVGEIIAEPWVVHPGIVPPQEHKARVADLLERVGLSARDANRHPHEFSGGQRQRIGIARALTLNPSILICDEPVSALDVSIQAQIINLLEEIQDEFGLAYIFIAHDLSVVRHISDRVAVMYLGRIVETGPEKALYETPTHPYTQALLSAVPIPDPDAREARQRIVLSGDIPSPVDPPSGCRFRTRCWKAQPRCAEEVPELVDRFGFGHPSACHFAELPQPAQTP